MTASTEDQPGILLVGGGRMGCALLQGWLDKGAVAAMITVIEPAPAQMLVQMQRDFGFNLLHAAPAHLAPAAVLMCVKPQVAAAVAAGIQPALAGRPVVISIMAGITIEELRHHFPSAAAVVRAMPNLAASVGRGVTVAVTKGASQDADLALANRLLAASGHLIWLADENQVDAATALSGSGPGYIFHLVECLARSGERLGLPPDIAEELARAVITGSGALLDGTGQSACALRAAVTSPGGTTHAGLAALMAGDALQNLIDRATRAATTRARELSAPPSA